MATFVYKDAHLTVNSVDLSEWVKSVSLTHNAAAQDDTAMGDDSTSALSGLKSWSMQAEFNSDFAASATDATINGLVGAAAVTVALKPTSAATSATNPSYGGSAICTSYGPMGGGVGDLAGSSATLQGTGDLARSTS